MLYATLCISHPVHTLPRNPRSDIADAPLKVWPFAKSSQTYYQLWLFMGISGKFSRIYIFRSLHFVIVKFWVSFAPGRRKNQPRSIKSQVLPYFVLAAICAYVQRGLKISSATAEILNH